MPIGMWHSAKASTSARGTPLAWIEGQIAFETIVRRYPELRLAVPEDEIVRSGCFLPGFRQVPLLF
jgi:cytochrome P450